ARIDGPVNVTDFDFALPPDLIAQEPPAVRGSSRLLYLDRASGEIRHTRIGALPELLDPGDVLVLNNTRVFPARLLGYRVPSGGAVECLLIGRVSTDGRTDEWEALMHPGLKLKPGARVTFEGAHVVHGEVIERRFFGRRLIRLWTDDGASVDDA